MHRLTQYISTIRLLLIHKEICYWFLLEKFIHTRGKKLSLRRTPLCLDQTSVLSHNSPITNGSVKNVRKTLCKMLQTYCTILIANLLTLVLFRFENKKLCLEESLHQVNRSKMFKMYLLIHLLLNFITICVDFQELIHHRCF